MNDGAYFLDTPCYPGPDAPAAAQVAVADTRSRFWTTANAAAGGEFTYWVRTMCAQVVELRIESPEMENFSAWIRQVALGSMYLNFIYTSAVQRAWRTEEDIRRSRDARFELLFVRAGSMRLEHCHKTLTLKPNECVLIDSTRPYFFETAEGTETTSLRIPQKWLRSWIATPEGCVAEPVTAATPWGKALVASLAALTANQTDSVKAAGEMLAQQIASLLALAVVRGPARLSSGQRRLLPRIRQSLVERAHDEMLTPAAVAQMHSISKRHLHTLFAAGGTTFRKELLTIRLEHGLRMLESPQFGAVSVSEISGRCGFSTPSHFARHFRQRYRLNPAGYRRSILARSVTTEAGV